MKGPELSSPSQPKLSIASDFRTIQSKPASARATTVSGLNPESTYYFRIIPKAAEPQENSLSNTGSDQVTRKCSNFSWSFEIFLFNNSSVQKYHWLKWNSKNG